MTQRKFSVSLIILITALAALLRFYNLGGFPQTLNQDEAAKGYNAYSLLKTGKSFRGLPWPLYFTDFSDKQPYTAILYNYSLLPSVALFGLTKTATRLPAAIYGTLTIPILYFLTQEILKNKTAALFSAFFLAISPWHILMSRLALEPITFPFLFFSGWLFLERSVQDKPKYLLPGMISLALSFYSYQTALLTVPLFLACFFLINREYLLTKKKTLFVSLILFLFFTTPIIFLFLTKTLPMTGHYHQVSIFQRGEGGIFLFLVNLTGHFLFSPVLIFLPLIFLALMGFLNIFKNLKTKPAFKILLINLFLVIIPPSLTVMGHFVPNPCRSIGMIGFIEIFAGYFLELILKKLPTIKKNLLMTFLFITLVLNVLWLIKLNFPYYFDPVLSFGFGFEKLVAYINSVEKNYQKIVVTDKINQPFIYFLFYGRYPPEKFQKETVVRRYVGSSAAPYEIVQSFDKYLFCNIDKCWDPNREYLYVAKPNEVPWLKEKATIKDFNLTFFRIIEAPKKANKGE